MHASIKMHVFSCVNYKLKISDIIFRGEKNKTTCIYIELVSRTNETGSKTIKITIFAGGNIHNV